MLKGRNAAVPKIELLRLYVMNTNTSFSVIDVCGTINIKTVLKAKGMLIHRSQGLAFPYLDFVRFIRIPIIKSVHPSKILEIKKIVPTDAIGMPATFV